MCYHIIGMNLNNAIMIKRYIFLQCANICAAASLVCSSCNTQGLNRLDMMKSKVSADMESKPHSFLDGIPLDKSIELQGDQPHIKTDVNESVISEFPNNIDYTIQCSDSNIYKDNFLRNIGENIEQLCDEYKFNDAATEFKKLQNNCINENKNAKKEIDNSRHYIVNKYKNLADTHLSCCKIPNINKSEKLLNKANKLYDSLLLLFKSFDFDKDIRTKLNLLLDNTEIAQETLLLSIAEQKAGEKKELDNKKKKLKQKEEEKAKEIEKKKIEKTKEVEKEIKNLMDQFYRECRAHRFNSAISLLKKMKGLGISENKLDELQLFIKEYKEEYQSNNLEILNEINVPYLQLRKKPVAFYQRKISIHNITP